MKKIIKIHGIQAKSGSKKCGFIKIGDLPSKPLEIPLVIINGNVWVDENSAVWIEIYAGWWQG